ncbi:MAG: heavy metal-responsive transcriptional regulator [Gemmatimonadales bacterium]
MTQAPLRIGQLASLAGATPDTLRYYERLGLLPRPARTDGGYRLYEHTALERIALIRKAHALGLTLREVREVLEIASGGRDPCTHVRALLERRLGEIRTKIVDLRSLERTLAKVLADAQRSPPGEACVCNIIESTEMRSAERGMRNRKTRAHSAFRNPQSAFKSKEDA